MEELQHDFCGISLKKKKSKETHLYIRKEWKNGKWNYYYEVVKRPISRKKNVETSKLGIRKKAKVARRSNKWGIYNSPVKGERKKKMAKDIQLSHGAKGTQKQNHKYSAREWVNGKWKYFYGQASKAGNAVSTAATKAGNAVASTATGAVNTAKRKYKNYNSAAAKQSRERSARLRKIKTEKAIAAGKSKVNEIVSKLKKSATVGRAKAVNKYLNAKNKKKYETNRKKDAAKRAANATKVRNNALEAIKRTNYYNSPEAYKSYKTGKKMKTYEQTVAEREKELKKRARAQKKSKNKIAREQAVGKTKRTVKKAATRVTKRK